MPRIYSEICWADWGLQHVHRHFLSYFIGILLLHNTSPSLHAVAWQPRNGVDTFYDWLTFCGFWIISFLFPSLLSLSLTHKRENICVKKETREMLFSFCLFVFLFIRAGCFWQFGVCSYVARDVIWQSGSSDVMSRGPEYLWSSLVRALASFPVHDEYHTPTFYCKLLCEFMVPFWWSDGMSLEVHWIPQAHFRVCVWCFLVSSSNGLSDWLQEKRCHSQGYRRVLKAREKALRPKASVENQSVNWWQVWRQALCCTFIAVWVHVVDRPRDALQKACVPVRKQEVFVT